MKEWTSLILRIGQTTYNWGAIAPGVDAPIPGVLSIQSVDDVTLTGEIGHEGGFNQ